MPPTECREHMTLIESSTSSWSRIQTQIAPATFQFPVWFHIIKFQNFDVLPLYSIPLKLITFVRLLEGSIATKRKTTDGLIYPTSIKIRPWIAQFLYVMAVKNRCFWESKPMRLVIVWVFILTDESQKQHHKLFVITIDVNIMWKN